MKKNAKKIVDQQSEPGANMPMPAMPMNVAAEMPRVDPAREEGNKLADEARRALRRLLAHEAAQEYSWRLGMAAKSLDALDGNRS